MRTAFVLSGLLAASGLAAAAEPPAAPAFAKKPAAARDGDKVKIEFAVSRETDVAIYIENAKGEIVRHLVAGVLGKNPPEPLKANSLEQSVLWDGKDDDGKPAAGGPFRVRVAAGLSPRLAGTAFEEAPGPDNLTNVIGLAAGREGRVYVLSQRWGRAWWTATAIHVFRRSGEYERTIKPMPGNLAPERTAALGALADANGRSLPIIHRILAMSLYPYEDTAQQMAVTADGNLHFVVVPLGYRKPPQLRLATLDGEGGAPYKTYAGEILLPSASQERLCLAPASDGKAVYVAGISSTGKGVNAPVVYRTGLPERGPLAAFFGDEKTPGADQAHLANPCGLATDGAGRLFIADAGNNRVVAVREKDRGFLGSFDVPAPAWVGVSQRTGTVYVASAGQLLKFSAPLERAAEAPWTAPKELGRAALPSAPAKSGDGLRWYFALDAESEPAVIWAGRDRGDPALFRCAEAAGKLGDFEPAKCRRSRELWNVTVSQDRREVACKDGGEPWNGGKLLVMNEETGKIRQPQLTFLRAGNLHRIGPNGQIYALNNHTNGLYRFDRDGKRLPFESGTKEGTLPVRPSGTTCWERDFCVDRSGNIYVRQQPAVDAVYHGRHQVDEYGPDGKLKRTVIQVVTDGSLGPKVDLRGNIYMAECIKPPGVPFPELFKGKLPMAAWHRGNGEQQYTWMYGSIAKFGPQGGSFWFPIIGKSDVYDQTAREKMPKGLSKQPFASENFGKMVDKPGELEGAEWFRFGCSYLLDMGLGGGNWTCHCTATDFDVDDFGRVFHPDQGRFRAVVLDTNGNEITSFGGYGNQDSCGPDSYVLDPDGKFLRPRRKDDPPTLVSPLAGPEIAIGWNVGLGVSDRYVYLADALNRRVLRVRLTYELEAQANVP